MNKKFVGCLIVLCAALFLSGTCTVGLGRPAEAKTKKIVRKARRARRIRKVRGRRVRRRVVRKVTVRKARKVTLAAKKKLPRARTVAQKAAPSPSGTVTQNYSLEEGVGGDEVDNLISGLKSVGADEVSVDSGTNTVSITYHTSRLTPVGIVRKMKSLGYTAKRAY